MKKKLLKRHTNRKRSARDARRYVVDRLPISKRKPLKKSITEALARWMATLEEDVRETFDYSAIELRVVWSYDNEEHDHFRELIVTTEGRRSR